MENKSFEMLNLSQEINQALQEAGYKAPSLIQEKAIPEILKGNDIFGCAQTGTGKTAAFVLPILDTLHRQKKVPTPKKPDALILTPTRELAEQVGQNIQKYSKHTNINCVKIYGGARIQKQAKELLAGVNILVATPGRLLDFIRQKKVSLENAQFLVLDEADRMLDMGFVPDVRKICSYMPKKRQSLLFSATLSKQIEALANEFVVEPVSIKISPDKPAVDKIDQSLCYVKGDAKVDLTKMLITRQLERFPEGLILVFCKTKKGTNKLHKHLLYSKINSEAIHSDKSQSARQKSLDRFREGKSKVLVATDVAARGIDVKFITLVINYDMPQDPETYVHRIGRTARAEADGEAISFCTSQDMGILKAIQNYAKKQIKAIGENELEKSYWYDGNVAGLVEKMRAKLSQPRQRKGKYEDKNAPSKKSSRKSKRNDKNQFFKKKENIRKENRQARVEERQRFDKKEAAFDKARKSKNDSFDSPRRSSDRKGSFDKKEKSFDKPKSRKSTSGDFIKSVRFSDEKPKRSSKDEFSEKPKRGKFSSFGKKEASFDKPRRSSERKPSFDKKPRFSDKAKGEKRSFAKKSPRRSK